MTHSAVWFGFCCNQGVAESSYRCVFVLTRSFFPLKLETVHKKHHGAYITQNDNVLNSICSVLVQCTSGSKFLLPLKCSICSERDSMALLCGNKLYVAANNNRMGYVYFSCSLNKCVYSRLSVPYNQAFHISFAANITFLNHFFVLM